MYFASNGGVLHGGSPIAVYEAAWHAQLTVKTDRQSHPAVPYVSPYQDICGQEAPYLTISPHRQVKQETLELEVANTVRHVTSRRSSDAVLIAGNMHDQPVQRFAQMDLAGEAAVGTDLHSIPRFEHYGLVVAWAANPFRPSIVDVAMARPALHHPAT